LAVAPSAAVYGELLSARSFAGTLLGRSAPRHQPDLTVAAGWLSSLLAISAADLGDHAAAVIWCADTERRGRDASYPELLGWAVLTRSLIAWYQGDPLASAAAAQRGQADGQPRSVAHAKLAAQEMRCWAMLGDAAGMAEARRKAVTAMAQLGPPTPAASVYSIPRAEDPPYTATSLLLTGRYAEAAQMTQRMCKWYHLRTIYSLATLLPEAAPFHAISWEPVYAGTLVTRASWPKIPDGRRRVLRESQEVPRRVAEGTYRAARKADGAWQLS
jgi:hypothetical protein